MSRRRKIIVFSMIILAVVLLSWGGFDYWRIPEFGSDSGSGNSSSGGRGGQVRLPSQLGVESMANSGSDAGQTQLVKRIPKAALTPDQSQSQSLPPSPPLPQVPVQSNQKQRREAFQLNKSVDHIVLKNEPFQVDGKKLTIGGILRQLNGTTKPASTSPPIEEQNLGSNAAGSGTGVRTQVPRMPAYYGVRVVRPGENLWNIDYAIIREYFARRHIILPAVADEPAPDGRSSGIGRLLQFLEGVVYIYNVQEHRLDTNPNLIHPSAIVVFFNISDLFAALNQLQPQDLRQLHYVKDTLRLKTRGENKELLNQQVLRN